MSFSLGVVGVALAAAPLAPARLLPGDDVIGQAAGTQDEPALVEGDGTTWLLVWRDTRAALAGTLASNATDVYGIRVDANGVPLDPVAFPVASGPWSESGPRAAFNGTDWLVAYEADAPTASYWSQGVFARRVDPTGVVLDANAIWLADAESADEALWDVASDGASWAVLWQGLDLSLGSFVLEGTTVTGAGKAAPGARIDGADVGIASPWNARLAWGGDRYLAVWNMWGDDDDIGAVTLDGSLASLGPAFDVVGDNHSSVEPTVAAGDGDFYVAWFDNTFGGVWGTVRGTPVAADGTVAVDAGASVSDESWPIDAHPDVAWTGSGWGVGWEIGAAAAIGVSLVEPLGSLDGWFNATGAYGYTREPTVADGDGRFLLAWATYGDRSDFDLQTMSVDADGTLGAVTDATLAAPAQTHPAIAGDAGGFLVVARSQTADEEAILAWRLDGGGDALDTGPIEIARGIGVLEPVVAWNGSVWLVVWTDLDANTAANGIVGVRVAADGTVLDSAPIGFLTGGAGTVAASVDGTFLVAGVVPETFDTNTLRAVRVSSDGVVLDANERILGSNYAEAPDATAFGTGWIVTWAHRHSHDSGLRDANYTIVAASGEASPEALVRTSGSVALESGVNVASDGTSALVVWSDDGDVRGRFVDATGALVGNGAGFLVSGSANSQFDPDVTWNGTDYAVAWTDYRVHPTLEPGEGDVYTTRVDAAGAVSNPAGTPVGTLDVPEGNAALAGADGATVFVWTELVDASPYGAFRLQVSDDGPLDPVDTGAGDTGVVTSDTGEGPVDTGVPGGDTDEEPQPPGPTDEETGCGCAAGPGDVAPGLLLLTLGLVAWRRVRRA